MGGCGRSACRSRRASVKLSVTQGAANGAHGPIVPQDGAEERVALPRGEVEASAKGIVEIGCVMHTATEYKPSVAIARHGAR